MTPTHSTRKGKRYRYYVCSAAQKNGWSTCPSKAVPAGQLEALVAGRVAAAGEDPAVLADVLDAAQERTEAAVKAAALELRRASADLRGVHGEIRRVSATLAPGGANAEALARLADLHDRAARGEAAVRDLLAAAAVRPPNVDPAAAATALAEFDGVWSALTPREQGRLLGLLVEAVTYDGGRGKLAITFRPAGIATLAKDGFTEGVSP